MRIQRWLAALFLLSSPIPSPQGWELSLGRQRADSRHITVNDLVGVRTVGSSSLSGGDVQISPDGRWVVFQVRRTLLDRNSYAFDLWLVNSAGASAPRQLTRNEPVKQSSLVLAPRWSPDSKSIVYLSPDSDEIRLVCLDDFNEQSLTKRTDWRGGFEDLEPGPITNVQWSPDGRSIAFITSTKIKRSEGSETQGVEADVEWFNGRGEPSFKLLCGLDLENRSVKRLMNSSLDVRHYDWSPDGSRLVASAIEDAGSSAWGHMRSDLYLIEREGGKTMPLVKQEGIDDRPVWSPDGRWIGFASQRGKEDWIFTTWLAVVPASGGKPKYLTEEFQKGSGGSHWQMFWSGDSQEIFFTSFYHMSQHLFRIPFGGGRVVNVTPEDGRYYSEFSHSEGVKALAFIVQSVTETAEVYVSSPTLTGMKKLMDLNPQLKGVIHAQVETLKWRSCDGRWDIHGVLVKPPDYQPRRKYPLLVLLNGGPSMVQMKYGLNPQFPVEVFASKGYLVLSPNTRGRQGYGYAFAHAIGDEKSYGAKPLDDALSGVDELVKRGIVDHDRIGIMGHSYGGYLTAFAITQTDRFRAASVSEAHIIDLPGNVLNGVGNHGMKFVREMYGLGSPYDTAEMALMLKQSPAHQIQNVKTPALLEFGGVAGARVPGRLLFKGLQAFKVPSEFIVYPDEGHSWSSPLVREESFNRNIEWFDYWVLWKATERMAKRYGLPGQTKAKGRRLPGVQK
ncbi:MAG TPA: S9 family peptidase [Pyrinomonadaceae bacterium]|nr:S9 family peptidase [Pyrinomonadaceae bacterium]